MVIFAILSYTGMTTKTKNIKTSLLVLLLLLVVLLSAIFTYRIYQNAQLQEEGSEASLALKATEQTPYTDLEGNPFSFDAYRGTVRVVNVWASWSPFSTQELQDLETLATEYQDKNVTIIAINRKETKERAKAFLDTIGQFQNLLIAIDQTDAFYTSVGGFSMPETLFYDDQGNIVRHYRGALQLEQMRAFLEEARGVETQ